MLGARTTDRELLDHYVQGGDARAFEGLVERHGAAVHRVCRGVLKDIHEAEDAFQATFLVLARKAPVIREPEALGGWLRGVAYRVAVRARHRVSRAQAVEASRVSWASGEGGRAPDGGHGDLAEIVGSELSRLPEDYRRPIVLCYIDGLTHRQAADPRQWPVGTLKVRLVRGRRMLRERLDRRRVALALGLLAYLPRGRRACAVTQPLKEATVRAMVLEKAGRRAALRAEYPRAIAMADAAACLAGVVRMIWPWAAAIIAAFALSMAGRTAWALSGPPAPEVDPASLPVSLADVLNVECR